MSTPPVGKHPATVRPQKPEARAPEDRSSTIFQKATEGGKSSAATPLTEKSIVVDSPRQEEGARAKELLDFLIAHTDEQKYPEACERLKGLNQQKGPITLLQIKCNPADLKEKAAAELSQMSPQDLQRLRAVSQEKPDYLEDVLRLVETYQEADRKIEEEKAKTPGSAREKAEKAFYNIGKELVSKGCVNKAYTLLDEIPDSSPRKSRFLRVVANGFLQRGLFSNVLELIGRIPVLDLQMFQLLIVVLAEKGLDFSEAIKQALGRIPTSAEKGAFLQKIIVACLEKKLFEAADQVELYIPADSEAKSEALHLIILAALENDKWDIAISAVDHMPNGPLKIQDLKAVMTHFLWGKDGFDEDLFNQAVAVAEKLFDKKAAHGILNDAITGLLDKAMDREKLEEAKKFLKIAEELADKIPDESHLKSAALSRFFGALVKKGLGDEVLKKAALEPNDLKKFILLKDIMKAAVEAQGRFDEDVFEGAAKIMEGMHKTKVRDQVFPAYYELVQALLKKDFFHAAKKLADKIPNENEMKPKALDYMIENRVEKSKKGQAVEILKIASPELRNKLMAKYNLEEAFKEHAKSLKEHPTSSRIVRKK